MIKITNLQKKFGDKTAVNIDNLAINDGEILGLVGNNGAGKTTLFRLILDLMKANKGIVEVKKNNGSEDEYINTAASEEWKEFIGAFIDDGFLIDFLTPEEYFDFIGRTSAIDKKTIEERLSIFKELMADEILGQKKLIRDLSAGNKQKVGIISAMLTQPSILILDEPFNFLDPTSQNVLKRILVEYNQQIGATIIVSTKELENYFNQ